MKAVKAILVFVVGFFALILTQRIVELGEWVSRGNIYVLIGYYALLMTLTVLYLVLPIIGYYHRPSLKQIEAVMAGDAKMSTKVRRYLLNELKDEDHSVLKSIDKKDHEAIKKWVVGYIEGEAKGFDKIIQSYSYKITSLVLLSPNSMIDGLSIIFGTSSMMYQLSSKIKFRYTAKELVMMYFSIFSMASISGLLEEFDDEIEELIEDIIVETSDVIGEATGKDMAGSIPGLSVIVGASSMLFQAAGNYAFVMFIGKKFQYRIKNLILQEQLDEEEIRKLARREARLSRLKYMRDMAKGLGKSGFTKSLDAFRKVTSKSLTRQLNQEVITEISEELDQEILKKQSIMELIKSTFLKKYQ